MPSPMFWKRCGVSVKGATPIHCAPSAPMWVTPMIPRSMPMAMPWQPMPAAATLPSGTTVERLCGQPEQKNAVRAIVKGLGRRFISSRCWMRASDRFDPRLAREPLGDGPRDLVRVELADDAEQRALLLVELADDARPIGPAVQHVLGEQLEESALLLDDQDLLEPAAELADDARLHRREHRQLEDADAVAAQLRVAEAAARSSAWRTS